MEHLGINLVLALVVSICLLKYWRVVLGIIAICLVGLAVFGLLTLLVMLGFEGW